MRNSQHFLVKKKSRLVTDLSILILFSTALAFNPFDTQRASRRVLTVATFYIIVALILLKNAFVDFKDETTKMLFSLILFFATAQVCDSGKYFKIF